MRMRRRRPLLRAAMVGGAGYMAGKAGQRAAYREQEQETQLQQPAYQQAQPPQPAPAQAPAAGGDDLVGKIKELSDLKAAGVLSEAEFNAAKAKLLGT